MTDKRFAERLKRIEGRDRRSVRSAQIAGPTGLVREKEMRRRRFPWYLLIVAYLLFSTIKWVIVEQIGWDAYETRIAELAKGDAVEKVASFVLGPGLLTGGGTALLRMAGLAPEETEEQAPEQNGEADAQAPDRETQGDSRNF